MIRMTKRRNPTMEKRRRRSSQVIEAHQQIVEKLQQDFIKLEKDWNSFKSLKPLPLRQCSTQSNAIFKTLQLLINSPRGLMSSLQISRVRKNDAAREEILRDRKTAIESGKLKGRRLFEEVESETEVDFGEREEILSVFSYDNFEGSCERSKEEVVSGHCVRCWSGSVLSSSLFEEKEEALEVVGGGKVVGINVEKVKGYEGSVGVRGGRWMVLKGWFSIVLMVFAVGVIYMRRNGGYRDETEVMLVPT